MNKRTLLTLGASSLLLTLSQPLLAASSMPVYVTYDDGPNNPNTKAVLDFLAIYQMKASFFIVGRNIRGNERILRRIHDEGHTIGNHSWSHQNLRNLSEKAVFKELDMTNNAIRAVTGVTPRFFRPPYGDMGQGMKNRIASHFGMRTVMWDIDTMDWSNKSPQIMHDKVMSRIRPGAVVLMHDIHYPTALAGPRIYHSMMRAGYRSVGL